MTQKADSQLTTLVRTTPVQQQQERPFARAIAVEEALKIQSLLSAWIARAATSRIDTAQLFAFGIELSTWGEMLHLQEAFATRLIQQQHAWSKGWVDWFQQREQLTSANTMSKLVEQKFNLAGQLGELVRDQVTNFMALLENAQISYSYWVHEKLYPTT
jgi:hypothetical protein